MFTSRIFTPLPSAPESEDFFSSALPVIFTDHVQNSHGTPGSSVTYHSPRFGEIVLRIPAHPDVEEGRKLFAHYLWNAGVVVADAIEVASQDEAEPDTDKRRGGEWDTRYWDVRGKNVLELGAATALPSLISALSGASSTTITDHPSSPALTTGAIEQNVKDNILDQTKAPHTTPSTTPLPVVNIFGYTWGTTKFYVPSTYGKPAPPQSQPPESFDRIIIADCLWMASQHGNLIQTILRYLDPTTASESGRGCSCSCALVVAGFHTGRGIVRHFFELATGEFKDPTETDDSRDVQAAEEPEEDAELREFYGRLKAAEIFEIDVNGERREWEPVREGENKDQAKRWCVCAVLVRR